MRRELSPYPPPFFLYPRQGIWISLNPLTPVSGWCANHDKDERGRAIVARLNGGIEGYNVDFHYEIIKRTVERERAISKALHGESLGFWQDVWATREIFMGVNGVSRGSTGISRCCETS
jgi:hypothetical protein